MTTRAASKKKGTKRPQKDDDEGEQEEGMAPVPKKRTRSEKAKTNSKDETKEEKTNETEKKEEKQKKKKKKEKPKHVCKHVSGKREVVLTVDGLPRGSWCCINCYVNQLLTVDDRAQFREILDLPGDRNSYLEGDDHCDLSHSDDSDDDEDGGRWVSIDELLPPKPNVSHYDRSWPIDRRDGFSVVRDDLCTTKRGKAKTFKPCDPSWCACPRAQAEKAQQAAAAAATAAVQ